MKDTIRSHKKLFIVLITVAAIIIGIIVSVQVFKYYHPTHYKFNDRFVIGSTIEEIEKKYGELTMSELKGQYHAAGYYLADEGVAGFSLLHPRIDELYWIYFDENYIAQSVKLTPHPGG